MKLVTPGSIQKLQKALYERAKRDPSFRFYALYDKVYREDVLDHAYRVCRANRGAAGPDGMTFEDIEQNGGAASLLARLAEELKTKKYRPGSVRRVYIPKANGGERPLGIPDIRDRVVAMAVKLVLALGYRNIHYCLGDGSIGLPEGAPYDRILVSAAAPRIPPALVEQLAEQGMLAVPVGPPTGQDLVVGVKRAGQLETSTGTPCIFVRLVGDQGFTSAEGEDQEAAP